MPVTEIKHTDGEFEAEARLDEKGFKVRVEHPGAIVIIENLVQLFKQYGGQNYLSMSFTDKEDGKQYEVLIQNRDGLTPADKNMLLDKEIISLKARIAELEENKRIDHVVCAVDDETVEYDVSQEIKDKVFNRVVKFFFDECAFNGECIHQMDNPTINAPCVLSDIADDIIKFKVTYGENK